MNWRAITSMLRDTRAALSKSDLSLVALVASAVGYMVVSNVTRNHEADTTFQVILLFSVAFLWWNTTLSNFYFWNMSKISKENLELANENLALYESEVAKWKRVNSEIGEAIVECEHFNEAAKIAVARTCGRILYAMEDPDDD